MGRKVLKSKIYRGYDLIESTKTEDGYYTKTLDQIIDMTELMMKRHCKTLSVRIDIHNAQDAEIPMSRREITRTLENTQRNLKKALSANHLPDIHCVWVEEKAHEDRHPHYHLQFFANGNAIQNGYRIFQELERQIQRRTGRKGLVHFCRSNEGTGRMIQRSAPDADSQLREVIRFASYLAKVQGKERLAKGSRVSSASHGFSVAAPFPDTEDSN